MEGLAAAQEAAIPMAPGRPGLPLPRGGWLGWAAAWLRRVTNAPAAGEAALRIEARLGMGPKKSLVLVSCRGRQVLLALSGEAIVPVLELGPESGAAAGVKRSVRRSPGSAGKGAAQ
jgi:hypothetical protein